MLQAPGPDRSRRNGSPLSQALQAIRRDELPAEAGREPPLALAKDVAHFDGGLAIRVAGRLELRRIAWRLTYECYRRKGYAGERADGLWYGPHDARPETLTLLCERAGLPVATLTLVFDSPWRLPADEFNPDPLDTLRACGRRLCELVSLVSVEEGLRGAGAVLHLFKLAYLAARNLEQATDFVIAVHPRHAPFYRHALLFTQLGAETPCPRVSGAPAVLLGLDLLGAEAAFRQRYTTRPGPRNRHRFFLDQAAPLTAWLARNRRVLDARELKDCFPGGVPEPSPALVLRRN